MLIVHRTSAWSVESGAVRIPRRTVVTCSSTVLEEWRWKWRILVQYSCIVFDDKSNSAKAGGDGLM